MRKTKDRSVHVLMNSVITAPVNHGYGNYHDHKSFIGEALNNTMYHMMQHGFMYNHERASVVDNQVVMHGTIERIISVKAGTYKAAEDRARKMATDLFSIIKACGIVAENTICETTVLTELAS